MQSEHSTQALSCLPWLALFSCSRVLSTRRPLLVLPCDRSWVTSHTSICRIPLGPHWDLSNMENVRNIRNTAGAFSEHQQCDVVQRAKQSPTLVSTVVHRPSGHGLRPPSRRRFQTQSSVLDQAPLSESTVGSSCSVTRYHTGHLTVRISEILTLSTIPRRQFRSVFCNGVQVPTKYYCPSRNIESAPAPTGVLVQMPVRVRFVFRIVDSVIFGSRNAWHTRDIAADICRAGPTLQTAR
jgi:hypothetical protein